MQNNYSKIQLRLAAYVGRFHKQVATT